MTTYIICVIIVAIYTHWQLDPTPNPDPPAFNSVLAWQILAHYDHEAH